ncbi:MAG: hypothetical protein WBP16_10930 [Ferruginibacter sp.]
MKYLNITRNIAIIAMVSLVFTACKKATVATPMGDAGQTLVKIINAGTPAGIAKMPVDFVPTPTKLLAVQLRRDIPNEAELNKTMVVTLVDDTAAVTAASASYNHLPTAWYTLQMDGVKTGGQGGTFTFTFAPGEFSKEIYVIIPDATVMDPSSLYGLGFTITSADAGGIITAQKSLVVEIGAKNDWDGIYLNQGTFVDLSNAVFLYGGDQQYSLVTSGATTCVVINDDLNGGIPGYVFDNAGSGTYYGSYGLVISFNPANGAISDLHNYYGDPAYPATGGGNPATGTGAPLYAASNGRRAELDPSGVNAAQGNKNIIIKHWLMHPSVVPVGPRSIFDETWKYTGPR